MTAVDSLVRLVRYRECMSLLVGRALKVRYRRSVIGFGWMLLHPLLATCVLTVVFSGVFDVPRYPVYAAVGVLAWSCFSVGCSQAIDSLLSGAPILMKVRVPSAVFPIAAVGASLVNFTLAIAVVLVISTLGGVVTALHPLWLITGLLSLSAFTLGTALALAAANVFFRDVRYFFEALMPVLFYATPIAYPAHVVPAPYSVLVNANPMHWFLELLRAAVWSDTPPAAGAPLIAPLIGAGVLVAGWIAFTRLERRFYLYL